VASCSLSFVEDEFPCCKRSSFYVCTSPYPPLYDEIAWSHGDAFSLTCEVDLYEEYNEDFPEDEIPFPGRFEVTWRRSVL
jgi:hypothetical protein